MAEEFQSLGPIVWGLGVLRVGIFRISFDFDRGQAQLKSPKVRGWTGLKES